MSLSTRLDFGTSFVDIEYNPSNGRITQATYQIGPRPVRFQIFLDGVQRLDRVYPANTSGSENITGNWRVIETIDPIDDRVYLSWPAGLSFQAAEV